MFRNYSLALMVLALTILSLMIALSVQPEAQGRSAPSPDAIIEQMVKSNRSTNGEIFKAFEAAIADQLGSGKFKVRDFKVRLPTLRCVSGGVNEMLSIEDQHPVGACVVRVGAFQVDALMNVTVKQDGIVVTPIYVNIE